MVGCFCENVCVIYVITQDSKLSVPVVYYTLLKHTQTHAHTHTHTTVRPVAVTFILLFLSVIITPITREWEKTSFRSHNFSCIFNVWEVLKQLHHPPPPEACSLAEKGPFSLSLSLSLFLSEVKRGFISNS